MNSFTTLLVMSTVSIALAVLFFFMPQLIAPVPYGTLTFGLATIICFWLAVRVGRSIGGAPESLASLLKTMRAYFLMMGIFFFLDWFPHIGIPLVYPNEVLASHFHTFAHIFFFIGNAIIIRVPVSFINARWKNAASVLMLLLGMATVAYRFIHLDKLIYAFGPTVPPLIIADKASGLFFLVANGLGLFIPGLYLIYRGIRALEHDARVRAIFLGLGMAIFFSIGPVIDIVQNQYTQLLIHLLQASSFFFIGASAVYTPRAQIERSPSMTSAPSRV